MKNLPTELLNHIISLLERSELYNLCLTNKLLQTLTTPHLYTTLEFSDRKHFHNLEEATKTSKALRYTLENHVRTFRFRCQHNEPHGLIYESRFLLSQLQLHSLITIELSHLLGFRVENFMELAQYLSKIQEITFSYCELTVDRQYTNYSSYNPPTIDLPFLNVHTLTFLWTDFSTTAITRLLRRIPNLKKVAWGFNHNRSFNANDSSITALTRYCPEVEVMDICLQEVREESFCNAIRFYGTRLRELKIRCESDQIFSFIAFYATGLHQLELVCYGRINNPDTILQIVARCSDLKKLVLEPSPSRLPDELLEAGYSQGVDKNGKKLMIEGVALEAIREKLMLYRKELFDEPKLD